MRLVEVGDIELEIHDVATPSPLLEDPAEPASGIQKRPHCRHPDRL